VFAELTNQLSRDYLEASDESPVFIYANLDFGKRPFPPETRRLLDFVDEWGMSWGDRTVLEYLEEHQHQFRNCLDWISKACVTDLTDEVEELEPEHSEWICWENWQRKPEVKFLKCHGLEHIESQLRPTLHDGFVFKGLEIDPGRGLDPLDPICWLTLLLLKKFGTGFVRRCEYVKCKKFIFATKRRHFCSDSCRAQQHALEDRRRDPEDFRRRQAEYMRKNRLVHRRRRNRMSKRNPQSNRAK
jgi:hypothetical protein